MAAFPKGAEGYLGAKNGNTNGEMTKREKERGRGGKRRRRPKLEVTLCNEISKGGRKGGREGAKEREGRRKKQNFLFSLAA